MPRRALMARGSRLWRLGPSLRLSIRRGTSKIYTKYIQEVTLGRISSIEKNIGSGMRSRGRFGSSARGISTFLYGRPKTDEEKAIEAEAEQQRLERIKNMPLADHKELIDAAVLKVRKDTLDLYEKYQKRRQLGRFRKFFRKTIPNFKAEIRELGMVKSGVISVGLASSYALSSGIFELLGKTDRLLGWGFYMGLLCFYLWKSDDFWLKYDEYYLAYKYPKGLNVKNLQYELRIPDDATAEHLFKIITEEAPDMLAESKSEDGETRIVPDIILAFKRPTFYYENALEMFLDSWDFDNYGVLNKVQVSPIVHTLINADVLKPQDGAVFEPKNDKDFPPNWKEPHNEEVLVWPLDFIKGDYETEKRAAGQVAGEILVLHGMQFEGEKMDGELSDLQFPGTIEYLAARCGFSSAETFKDHMLRYITRKLADVVQSKADDIKRELEENKTKKSTFSMLFPGMTTAPVQRRGAARD